MSEEIIDKEQIEETVQYNDDNITHLSDVDHIRTRPGMYIGRLGDGSHTEDGIYVLLKEAIDNSIDEFRMNAGKRWISPITNALVCVTMAVAARRVR